MEKKIFVKPIVIGLFILCIGAGFVPSLSDASENISDNEAVIVTVNQRDNTLQLSYRIPEYTQQLVTIEGNTYSLLSLGEEAQRLQLGYPALPHISRSLIIPDDSLMVASVVSAEYQEYYDVSIAPSKGVLYRTVNPDEVPYEFSDIYEEDTWYPSEIVSLGDPYILRDFRGQVVDVTPFQYNPATHTLRAYTSIDVEVAPVGKGGVNVFTRSETLSGVSSDFSDVYARQFINYEEGRYTPLSERGNMLVIAHDSLYDAMIPFVQWKNMKGIPTQMVKVSTVGSTATAIKSYITSYYYSNGLTFVLLVGDVAQIPTFSVSGGGSDPTYSYILGGDHYPDLFVGRFSASTVAQVNTMVLRSVEYEKLPQTGAAWYHKGTGIASNQGPGDDGEYDNQHMDNIRTDLLGYTYTEVDRIYDPSGTAAQVAAALNNGRSIVNYCGHGSSTSWGTTGFSNSNINALTNDNMLPFIWSVACYNGDFTHYDACFAEAWLRATHNGEPTGAIAVFMSSISQSWDPPMAAQDESVDILVESYVNNKKNTFGALSFLGCMLMNDQYGSQGYTETDAWHVFGDPSIQVRTNTPVTMSVQHAALVPAGATTFQVTVVGIKDALCAISKNYVLLGSAYTDANGLATITFSQPITEGPVDLVVTAYNKIPYMTQLPVGVSVDPNQSFVTLTNSNMPGHTTCPKGDGPAYNYIKVTVKDTQGQPMSGVPASACVFTVFPSFGTRFYGRFSVNVVAADPQTNGIGEIRFTLAALTSVVGNVTIRVKVNNVQINDFDILPCKSFDYFTDGDVDLSDFALFAQDYQGGGGTQWRSDFSWDGLVNLVDFSMFASHYGHVKV